MIPIKYSMLKLTKQETLFVFFFQYKVDESFWRIFIFYL